MTGLSTAALAELLSTACTTVGLALLVAAGCLRWLRRPWTKTLAVALVEDGRPRLRWHTTRYELHEEHWPTGSAPPPEPGAEVTVYYRARHPGEWQLTDPHGRLRLLAGAGALLAAGGVLGPVVVS